MNSPHKRPVTRKKFPFDDVIMCEWADDYTKLSLELGYGWVFASPGKLGQMSCGISCCMWSWYPSEFSVFCPITHDSGTSHLQTKSTERLFNKITIVTTGQIILIQFGYSVWKCKLFQLNSLYLTSLASA